MKLAWLSEGGYTGKVPREQTANAGVLWAWMSNLEVDHFPILNFEHAPTDGYDYLILQIPKTPEVRTALFEKDIVKQARRIAKARVIQMMRKKRLLKSSRRLQRK